MSHMCLLGLKGCVRRIVRVEKGPRTATLGPLMLGHVTVLNIGTT